MSKKIRTESLHLFSKTLNLFDNSVLKLFINTPKEFLHPKNRKRAEQMFRKGAVKEVKSFLRMKINKDLTSNKIIGIKEISDYIENNITLDQAKELIK